MNKNDDPRQPESALPYVMPWVAIITVWLCAIGIVAICVAWLPDFTFANENGWGFLAILAPLVTAAMTTLWILRHL